METATHRQQRLHGCKERAPSIYGGGAFRSGLKLTWSLRLFHQPIRTTSIDLQGASWNRDGSKDAKTKHTWSYSFKSIRIVIENVVIIFLYCSTYSFWHLYLHQHCCNHPNGVRISFYQTRIRLRYQKATLFPNFLQHTLAKKYTCVTLPFYSKHGAFLSKLRSEKVGRCTLGLNCLNWIGCRRGYLESSNNFMKWWW